MVIVGLLLLAAVSQLRRLAGKSLASRLAALSVQLRPYLQPNKARLKPCFCIMYARVSGNTRSVANLRRI
jgi:hypothetical protein